MSVGHISLDEVRKNVYRKDQIETFIGESRKIATGTSKEDSRGGGIPVSARGSQHALGNVYADCEADQRGEPVQNTPVTGTDLEDRVIGPAQAACLHPLHDLSRARIEQIGPSERVKRNTRR